jgi:hypothetical protein
LALRAASSRAMSECCAQAQGRDDDFAAERAQRRRHGRRFKAKSPTQKDERTIPLQAVHVERAKKQQLGAQVKALLEELRVERVEKEQMRAQVKALRALRELEELRCRESL